MLEPLRGCGYVFERISIQPHEMLNELNRNEVPTSMLGRISELPERQEGLSDRALARRGRCVESWDGTEVPDRVRRVR